MPLTSSHCVLQQQLREGWVSLLASQVTRDKEFACQCRRHKRRSFDPWVGKRPWSRTWQPIAVLLPGKFPWQRSLAGYGPCGHKELVVTEHTHNRWERWGLRHGMGEQMVSEGVVGPGGSWDEQRRAGGCHTSDLVMEHHHHPMCQASISLQQYSGKQDWYGPCIPRAGRLSGKPSNQPKFIIPGFY